MIPIFVTIFRFLRYISKPNLMFKLQLKLALRHLYRHRSFTFINLTGLSLGLAAFIYVLILVSHETRFDNFYTDG